MEINQSIYDPAFELFIFKPPPSKKGTQRTDQWLSLILYIFPIILYPYQTISPSTYDNSKQNHKQNRLDLTWGT